MLPRWISPVVRSAAGVVAALVALEIALRSIATPGLPPLADIPHDALTAPSLVHRQVDEGVATSHYSIYGARLTGNPPLDSGVTAVILGDSYVVAEQVTDGNTMGARLEDIARGHGVPLDVRQYGWTAASPAQYLYVAPDVMKRWHPRRVFIVVASNDFDRSALQYSAPRYRVGPDGSLHVIGDRMPVSDTVAPRGSVLLTMLRRRWGLVTGRLVRHAAAEHGGAATPLPVVDRAPNEPEPDSAEYARAPAAVIRALSKAFGPALSVVYIADVGIHPDTVLEPEERRMLAACVRFSVDCVSTRDSMLAALARGEPSHGVGIRPYGGGHLNPSGHWIMARLMWDHFTGSAVASSGVH
jgi:hypothetical protein